METNNKMNRVGHEFNPNVIPFLELKYLLLCLHRLKITVPIDIKYEIYVTLKKDASDLILCTDQCIVDWNGTINNLGISIGGCKWTDNSNIIINDIKLINYDNQSNVYLALHIEKHGHGLIQEREKTDAQFVFFPKCLNYFPNGSTLLKLDKIASLEDKVQTLRRKA